MPVTPFASLDLTISDWNRWFMKEYYELFINGREVPAKGGGSFAVENPYTRQVAVHVAEGREEDIQWAVETASNAFRDGRWSRLEARKRSQILQRAACRLAEEAGKLAEIESICTGRPIREMKAQVGRVPEWLDYFGAILQAVEGTLPPFAGPYLNYVRRIPLGVVGQLTPWNHPLLIAIKKVAPALAAGNSLVIKPSELAPVAVLELARICTEAGVPEGVINVVPGLGSVAGKALASHPGLAKIDLTGGTETGRLVAAAAGRNLVSVTCELGGKAPLLVFDDADLKEAVNGAAFAAFVASGQSCVQGARLIVHESISDEFEHCLVAKTSSLRLGDPLDPETQVGPLISEMQLKNVSRSVESARREGARILCGGSLSEVGRFKGYFYPPTVVAGVSPQMDIVRKEIFGPVTCILTFKDEQQAIEMANHSAYGLGAAVWTRDIRRAHRVAQALEAGIVWINDHHRIDPSSPWGGMKESGMGRENGWETLLQYTQTQSVIVNLGDEPFDWYGQGAEIRYS